MCYKIIIIMTALEECFKTIYNSKKLSDSEKDNLWKNVINVYRDVINGNLMKQLKF